MTTYRITLTMPGGVQSQVLALARGAVRFAVKLLEFE